MSGRLGHLHMGGRYLTASLTLIALFLLIPAAASAGESVESASSPASGAYLEALASEHDSCDAEGGPNDQSGAIASNGNTGFGGFRIADTAVGDGGPVSIVFNILILLLAAGLGAVAGYAIHKFSLFDRITRVKGAGL